MNTKTNMLRSKIIGATTLCAMGALAILPMNAADARLVFSTEFESSTEDSNGDGDFTLSFGSDLAGEISFNDASDTFTINNSTTIDGDSTVTGNSATTGNATVGGTLGVTGAATLSDDLTVLGDTNLQGNTDLDGILNVDGAATLNNGLSVTSGNTTLKDTTVGGTLNATGATDLDATLNVDGNTTLKADLDVDGNTTLDDTAIEGTFGVTGNSTLTGTLNTTGAVDFDSTLNVDGDTTLNNTAIEGTFDVTGASSFNGDITLNNDSQIIGLRAENKTLSNAPACADANDLGRIFYDTTNNSLLYCYENGGTFGWSSTSGDEVNASATYYAEFANFSVLADGTNNVGTMIAEYDDTADRSFYQWSTRQASANDYDVVLQWQVPSDFQSFQANSLQVDHKQGGTNAALAIDIEDDSNAAIGSTIAPANTATWATENVDLTSATVAAGDTLTFKFKMTAQTTEESFLSNVKINYVKK